jgi:hypothetical protein
MLATWLLSQAAHAFCGFYVAGSGEPLYNDATMVVLYRQGTKTVLSMQNTYQGPPEEFAMVVPVPHVLKKDDVQPIPRSLFADVDRMASPRLVEYWEQDPCTQLLSKEYLQRIPAGRSYQTALQTMPGSTGVKIEAQFEVAEYDIVILSATESTGLETWLRHSGYHLPDGAEPVLRPYVEAGTRFFVAKVDPKRLTFDNRGQTMLTPLRISYDSEQFSLPIRLGLLNSQGEQDLLVHILADRRYEVANRDNRFIPTNLTAPASALQDFGAYYRGLFDEFALPGVAYTEYAWTATTCDPCPGPALDLSQLGQLGAVWGTQLTLTRLHLRTSSAQATDDLVFRAAGPVVGGVGTPDAEGMLQPGVQPGTDGLSSFQGRYVVLHPWEREARCKQPVRGRWGPPTARSAANR